MNLNQQTISYCLIWGLEIDIGTIIFSDLIHKLQNGKKNKEFNIFYTRFLSLIFEKLLGENYINNDLTLVKPHTITAASFQKPLASEVTLTLHMLKVAKLFQEPEQSFIPPSREVNANDIADKSLSKASMQPVTQLKAPTDLKTKKKKIPPSSKPKSQYKVRVILPKKQVTETQHAEVTVATADATKSLEASELAREQVNQPLAAQAEKVLDQRVEETVHESGLVAIEDVTFEQIMDEFDSKTQTAQENTESPYDTESEIKIIKFYEATTISGSLFIHQSSSYDQDVIDITPKDAEEGDASKSLYALRSMPDDDLAFMTDFKTQEFADHVSEEGTETLHAFPDKPSQLDPLGDLHEELCLLNNKVNQLKSSITKHVSDSIQSTMPLIVTNTLKEQLPSLLSDALKDTLPQLIKDSIKSSISKSITEELPLVEAHVQKNLQDQLPLKPMYKEFNSFNKLKSRRFDNLQGQLSTVIKTNLNKSLRLKGEQHSTQVVPNAGQFPPINEEKALVLHTSEEKSSEKDTSGKKDTNDEPPAKKLKFLIPSSSIPSPTPLKSIMPGPQLTEAIKMTLDQFTEHPSKTTSSIFSPTPPREPTPSKDQTPPRDKSKGKKAQTQKMAEHEAKRLKTLGFSEWLEVHALTSKKSGTSNDVLL
nr:hypothetical protein [Tanacetum cinerariifolium]